MIVNPEVIAIAKAAFFPNLDKMPENVIEGFINWCNDNGKAADLDTPENREMMYRMAQFARAAWLF